MECLGATSVFEAITGWGCEESAIVWRVSSAGCGLERVARNAFFISESSAFTASGVGFGVRLARAGFAFGFSATTGAGFSSAFGADLLEAACFFSEAGVATTLGFASGWGHSVLARASDLGPSCSSTRGFAVNDVFFARLRFEKAKIPPAPARWMASTRTNAVVNERPRRLRLLMASRYSGSSIQCGCFVGNVVFVFIAASYAAIFVSLQITCLSKAA